ncbi:hypothetical protein FACS189429_7880 [Bacteroidia bacterium]|nr:hypothetical protein FACS189429_7880 [Bacteroidia bacterium]
MPLQMYNKECTYATVPRKPLTWLSDEEKQIARSSLYRCFFRNQINAVSQEKREQTKKFKEYDPSFVHFDLSYLPAFDGVKYYISLAIDRATRLMFYKIYDAKTAENATDFLKICIDFFPVKINKILSDNGLEFTDRLVKSKKGNICLKPSKFDETCAQYTVIHRLAKPYGMVERVNDTIKNATILKTKYQNLAEMQTDLSTFLLNYNFYRRHGSLQRELSARTPFQALCKWHKLKPEIFKIKPEKFVENFHKKYGSNQKIIIF